MLTSSAEGGRAPAFLSIEGLSAGYGAAPIVSEVSLQVGAGEVVAVVGPNGAGKSTQLKAVVGLLQPMAGRILLEGEDVTRLRTDRLARRGIGYVPQVNDCFDTLTVAENLAMGGYLLENDEVARRKEEVLAIFPNLSRMLNRTASKLSGGERKMLAMARVLMLRPKVLVLDEPTSNLSAQLSTMLLVEHVRRLADSGTAIFLVEQKAKAALEISNWSYVLAAGRVRLSAPAAELLARKDIGEVFLGRTGARQAATS